MERGTCGAPWLVWHLHRRVLARRGQSAALDPQGRVRLDRARERCGTCLRWTTPPSPSRATHCRSRRLHLRSSVRCEGMGTLRDASGAVSIHPPLRRQNTAVPGTVEQGKSSYLVATVAEDLRRERCAVIVLDPKGDAAEAAVSLVPTDRTCTLLDFSHPTCGFNPLAVDAPADTIADYVVSALKNLFSDGDIKASSDRYLRNAIIAVLAYDRHEHAVGRGTAPVGGGGGLRLPLACCRCAAHATGIQGDLRVLHRRALSAACGRARYHYRQAGCAGEQAGAAAQLALDQARPAQRLAAGQLRRGDRERRGAGGEGRARRHGRRQHQRAHAAARGDARRRARAPPRWRSRPSSVLPWR